MTTERGERAPFLHDHLPGIAQTFADGIRLVSEYPRQMLGPMLVIQVPVSIVTSIAIAVLYLTKFSDRDPTTLFPFEGDRSELFALAIIYAVEIFFTVISVAATIVAAAACARRSPLPVVEALDPAFTRIGRLLLLVITLYLGFVLLLASIIGIPVALYLLIRLGLSGQAFMLGEGTVLETMKTSWQRTSGYMLRLTGLVLMAVLALLVVVAFSSLLGLVEPAGHDARIVTIAGIGILQSIVVIPMEAAIVAMMTLFYLNAKVQAHDVTPA